MLSVNKFTGKQANKLTGKQVDRLTGNMSDNSFIHTELVNLSTCQLIMVYYAFSSKRVIVGRSQTSDGPKYWIGPG